MEKIRKILQFFYLLLLVVTILIIVFFELSIVESGMWAEKQVWEFSVMTCMELLTMLVAYLSLRLFKIKSVQRQLQETPIPSLMRWGLLRIGVLGTTMLINTLLYYFFLSTTFGYMAIILFLCMMFVFPSKEKCEYETTKKGDK